MMYKKSIAAAVALLSTISLSTTTFSHASLTALAADYSSKGVDALQYTYEVYPLLAPFNDYFYVKTDNPNPESFRFSDKDSPYSETSVIYAQLDDAPVYADVVYEDVAMQRVNGGYLFRSGTTNGGEVTLQIHEEITRKEFNQAIYGSEDPDMYGYSPYHGMPVDSYDEYDESGWYYYNRGYFKWVDTDVTITLPDLYDDVDYLIQNYATADTFFGNMDAVQKGFSSICLYSGSHIRGELYRKEGVDWSLSPSPYVDQNFYIYSPYSRRDNQYLFASALYPFRYDSIGFPSMMAAIAERLDSSATYKWSDSSHAHINVTYNGETKTYGGQGIGEGQGINLSDISHFYSFGEDESPVTTLQEARELLLSYAAIEMEDDIPREDALTWEKIYNIVGDGAWVDMGSYYTYLYQKDGKASFGADEWGVGNSLYWGGSLGYCSDTWVDGRYLSQNKVFIKGETFDDHPESSVLLPETVLPVIVDYESQWELNEEKGYYTSVIKKVTIERQTCKNVRYRYDKDEQLWVAIDCDYDTYHKMAVDGLIDESMLDEITLTREQVKAIVENGNADRNPEQGYVFDGTVAQGTPYFKGDCNDDGKRSLLDAITLQKSLMNDTTQKINVKNADLCKDRVINVYDLAMLKNWILKLETPNEPETPDVTKEKTIIADNQ